VIEIMGLFVSLAVSLPFLSFFSFTCSVYFPHQIAQTSLLVYITPCLSRPNIFSCWRSSFETI